VLQHKCLYDDDDNIHIRTLQTANVQYCVVKNQKDLKLASIYSSATIKMKRQILNSYKVWQELISRWDTRMWCDVSSYLFTYLPLKYDTPGLPEYFLSYAYRLYM